MPTATSFAALGRGNGLPFCAYKVDVTDPGLAPFGVTIHWMTLGGVSSGSASQAQIDLSLRNAMKLLWNLHSVQVGTFTASSEITGRTGFSSGTYGTISGWPNDSSSASLSNQEAVIQTTEDGALVDFLPNHRVCINSSGTFTGGISGSRQERDPSSAAVNDSSVAIKADFEIIRMYNGSKDDESNFVGYGCIPGDGDVLNQIKGLSARSGTEANARSTNSEVYMRMKINASSIQAGDTDSGIDPSSGFEFAENISNVNLGGMPFVAKTFIESRTHVSSSADVQNVTNTLSASSLSGTASSSFSVDFNGDGEFTAAGNGSISASITDLNFYTYN